MTICSYCQQDGDKNGNCDQPPIVEDYKNCGQYKLWRHQLEIKVEAPYATRYHDISCGHRVVGHEGKCRFLHGHNYRIHFTCQGTLDSVGRVIDFSIMKELLCQWLEDNWDHKFLAWDQDSDLLRMIQLASNHNILTADFRNSFVWVPFNPTAENIAKHLLTVIGPKLLRNKNAVLCQVRVEETAKCSANVSRSDTDTVAPIVQIHPRALPDDTVPYTAIDGTTRQAKVKRWVESTIIAADTNTGREVVFDDSDRKEWLRNADPGDPFSGRRY